MRGENEVKFYYVNDKSDSSNGSTIDSEEPDYKFENDDDQYNNRTQQQSAGAHGFCVNCGVHILRAPSRISEDLEINANCLEDGGKPSPDRKGLTSLSQRSSTTCDEEVNKTMYDEVKVRTNPIETVNENEQLLGGSVNFWESLDDRPVPPESYESKFIPSETKDISNSVQNSHPLTQSVTESDDYSMGSSSLHTATSSLHMLSVASGHVGVSSYNNREGLPPLPPSSGMSAKTLPPKFSQTQRTKYGGGRSVGAGHSNWSIASMESHELINADAEKSNTVTSERMNQMKYYMSRHMAKKK